MDAAKRFLDWMTRGARPYLLLVLLCGILYLPGLVSLSPMDRDESRFAQASKQMLESGDLIDIRFQDVPRHKKPIGIYWLQAASAEVTVGKGVPAIWAYRIPSALGALMAVLLTFYLGQAFFGRQTAFLAAALLGSCLLLTVEAHLAKTDAMLLATITAMQLALGRIYLDASRGKDAGSLVSLLFWLACGAAILIKGPVPLAIFLLTLATLMFADRSMAMLRYLRPWKGLLLVAAMVLPWLIAVSMATHGAFVKTSLGSDFLPKLISGQESHGAPFGFYAILFPALFWPGSLLAIAAIWPSWENRYDKAVRFCLAWIIPSWIMFEIVPTKLPHYVLPTFPAIALLTAHFLLKPEGWGDYLKRKPFAQLKWVAIGLWVLVGVILAAGLTTLPLILNHRLFLTSLPALLGTVGILYGFMRFGRRGEFKALAMMGVLAAVLVFPPTFQSILPGLEGPWISRKVADIVAGLKMEKPILASAGYREPSLVFLLGTETKLTDAQGAAANLQEHPNGLAMVTQKEKQDFLAAVEKDGVAVEGVAGFRGYNYSKGKWLDLEIYRRKKSEQ